MPNWLILLIAVPPICGVIGWITNVLAVKMIFRPYRAINMAGLGFQGVLPKHLDHFSRELATVITTDFMTTSELVSRLDLEEVLEQLKPRLEKIFDQLAAELKSMLGPGQQAMLTDDVLAQVRQQLEAEIRMALPEIRAEIEKRADEAVDLTDIIAEKVYGFGPAGLEDVIYRVARRELKFIEAYGGVFGFLIGLVQMGLIQFFAIRYSLPLVGAIVGIFTNYLAIQMLFYPRQPKGFGPFKIQGLFPKRQLEMAAMQAQIAAEDLIHVDEVFGKLRDTLLPEKVDNEMMTEVENLLSERYPMVVSTVRSILTQEQQDQFRTVIATRFTELAPDIATDVILIAAQYLDVEAILRDKIAGLSKLRFEQMLRGLFKEEEFYLVIYGGLLGGIMGGIQLGFLAALGG